MAQYVHFPIPPIPHQLAISPATTWGIAYDIYTRDTQDDLGDGWNSDRANTYTQLVEILRHAGYGHSQYSDYLKTNTDVVSTWGVMMSLMDIHPAGKMETTIKGLKMYTMVRPHLQDVTIAVRLGGNFARRLRGPTPIHHVEAVWNALFPVPHVAHNFFPLPAYTKPSAAAQNPQNWAI